LLVLYKKILFETNTHIIISTCTNKMLLHWPQSSPNLVIQLLIQRACKRVIGGIKRNRIEYYRVCILAERSKELTDSITGYTVTR